MKRITFISVLLSAIFFSVILMANAEVAFGVNAGFMPSIGGNMSSYFQSSRLGVENGIDGINRSENGKDTENIEQLVGLVGGGEFKLILYNYYILRIGINYARSIYGGEGKTLDLSDNTVKVKYSIWYYDVPFTVGLSIPFWKDVRITLNGGIAYARGEYNNSFKSSSVNSSASFSGWGLPKVIILSGEYFIDNNTALLTSVSYYEGSSEVIKNNGDFARIDFSGYRWNIGFSYYYDFKPAGKK